MWKEEISYRTTENTNTAKMAFLNEPMTYLAFSVLRFFQFILALTVCGLYGVDVTSMRKAHIGTDGRWVCLFTSSAA